MDDSYNLAFYDMVKETQQRSGLELPEHIEAYVVMLLASFVDRPNFLPTSSFAESYFKLKRPANIHAKELGDTCLFVTGVFPLYGSQRGMDRSYYQMIEAGSYDMVSEVMHPELFKSLAQHFAFVSDFIELTVSAQKTYFKHFL